jgi:hypothetical protein
MIEEIEPNIFSCEKCNYFTNNKKDYKKHLQRKKHLIGIFLNMEDKHKCECGKIYAHRSSLNNHKKKCNNQEIIVTKSGMDYEKMITTLIDENKELRKVLIEQTKVINEVIPKIGNTSFNSVNNVNNINNIKNINKFNINLFLNEQCKDAITMDNFIKSIEISLSNLLFSKDKGLVEGISNIFIENINKLPITQRPLHCTDVKRETIYIKNDTWEKDEKKEKTKDAIKKVSNLQTKNINKYKESNPDYMNSDKKKEDFINIIRVTTSDIDGKEEKIIKNICKEVYVNEDSVCENNIQ